MILIATVANDLHAQVVRELIRNEGSSNCHILELDRLAQHEALTYGISFAVKDRISTSDGETVSASDASVLWSGECPQNKTF